MWLVRLEGGPAANTVAQDLAALGVQDFEPPAWMSEPAADEEFGVLPENWDAVNVFSVCATQWVRREVNDGKHIRFVPVGLRYEGVDVVIRHSGVADPADTFRRVCVMESAAVREFARMAAEGA